MCYWKFEKTKIVSDNVFDELLKRFYKYGVNGLVRENIQNSLDAKLDLNEAVTVKVVIGEMAKNQVPGYFEIANRIKALKGNNEYSKEKIEFMNDYLYEDNCYYLSFEDFNTKGLSTNSDYNSIDDNSSYFAYAYGKGIHVEEGEGEEVKGGSHGVGKIASNAASKLNTMFFSNCDEMGNMSLGGSISLVDHRYDGENYRKVGYFTDILDDNYYPYKSTNFNDVFKKNERGLKIIIPFLHDDYNDEKEIIRSVCDSFLFAFLNKDLIVWVNDKCIDSSNIEEYISSDEYFVQTVEEIKKWYTPLYLKSYSNHISDEIYINDKDRYHRFHLYFTHDPNIQSGRTAIIRRMGMKIEDRKIKSYINKPYNAILFPFSKSEDEFLKSLENEAHNELDYKHISKSYNKESAKKFIAAIDRVMGDQIEKFLKNADDDSGSMDTSDIIYTVENAFKLDLAKRQSVLHISNGDKPKTIVKVTNTEELGSNKLDHNKKSNQDFEHVRAVKKTFGEDSKKVYYQLKGGTVKRAVHGEFESIWINLKNFNQIEGVHSGNLLISLIDGMGKEHQNEYNLLKEYTYVEDLNQQKKIQCEKDSIKGIDISKGCISLKMKLSKNNSKLSKLSFYLEV